MTAALDEREAVHRMALTEQQAGEPILEFFQYGSLRRVIGVEPFAPGSLPRGRVWPLVP